jgi:NarL family two-component system response regulator YdfI
MAMSNVLRVLIADDHLVVRTGLQLMLATSKDFELVGEATDGYTAIEQVEKLQPDVVLMDLRMPGMDGLEAIAQIHARWPSMAVVILTTYNEDELMIQGLQAGARGYLLKDCTLESLLNALRFAAQGEMLIPPDFMTRILSRSKPAPAPKPPPYASQELTEREREVLVCVANGERSKEIAAHLGISERTVGTYLSNIFAKLGVDSRASAVAVAIKRGLLPHT